jgi:DNA-directed RNA polymerase subunit RPC12/RpoP
LGYNRFVEITCLFRVGDASWWQMQITCPECRKKLNVPDTAAGKRVRCPACKHLVPIPALSVTTAPTPPSEADRVEPAELQSPADHVSPPPRATSVMRCAKCKALALERLPANQFTRNPGYACSECGAVMRPPGTTLFYVFVIVLGSFVVVFGMFAGVVAFSAFDYVGRVLVGAGFLMLLGGVTALWGVRQILLPVPLDAPPRHSRFWLGCLIFLCVVVVCVLVIGGALFGIMYYIQEKF